MPNITPDQRLRTIERLNRLGHCDLAEKSLDSWLQHAKSAQQQIPSPTIVDINLWKRIFTANSNIFITQHPQGTWATKKGLQGLIKYTNNFDQIMSLKPKDHILFLF